MRKNPLTSREAEDLWKSAESDASFALQADDLSLSLRARLLARATGTLHAIGAKGPASHRDAAVMKARLLEERYEKLFSTEESLFPTQEMAMSANPKGAYPWAAKEAQYADYSTPNLFYARADAGKAWKVAEENARFYTETYGPESRAAQEWAQNAGYYADDVGTIIKEMQRRERGPWSKAPNKRRGRRNPYQKVRYKGPAGATPGLVFEIDQLDDLLARGGHSELSRRWEGVGEEPGKFHRVEMSPEFDTWEGAFEHDFAGSAQRFNAPKGRRHRRGPSKAARAFISEKIPILMDEGYPQDQAIAIAYSMARRGGKRHNPGLDLRWLHKKGHRSWVLTSNGVAVVTIRKCSGTVERGGKPFFRLSKAGSGRLHTWDLPKSIKAAKKIAEAYARGEYEEAPAPKGSSTTWESHRLPEKPSRGFLEEHNPCCANPHPHSHKRRKSKKARRGNPATKKPRVRTKGEDMGVEDAVDIEGYEGARKAYRKFHGTEPTVATVYRVDDGKAGVERKVVTQLGHSPEVHYLIPEGQESPEKENTHWVHKTDKKAPPALLYDPQTKMNMLVGGAMKVEDWLYD